MPTVVIRVGRGGRYGDCSDVQVVPLAYSGGSARPSFAHAVLIFRQSNDWHFYEFGPSEVVVHRGDVWELCEKSKNLSKLWGME